jgi:predicted GNAT family acetyltransferase
MSIEVRRREHDYEVTVDGAVAGHAFIEEHGRTVVFTHTEIDPAYGGKGVGGALARAALDDVRARGMHLIPRCPFIRAWIDKHPEYADLVQGSHGSDGQA